MFQKPHVLTRKSFKVRQAEGLVIVRNMNPVECHKKLSETLDTEGKKHWITELIEAKRKPFPMVSREPLTLFL